MKVYLPATRGKRTVFVTPGAHFPVSHWMGADGKPQMYSVEFREGVADVSTELGQYMVERQLAKDSPIITLDML